MTREEALDVLDLVLNTGCEDAETCRKLEQAIEALSSADAIQVVRCKDCKNRYEDECPMYWEEQYDIDEGDGYYDTDYIFHDYTQDDGFCSWGERREQ